MSFPDPDLSALIEGKKYIVAVSGGIDSIVLLRVLAKTYDPSSTLIVAHFDHGMRDDSRSDREFVQALAAEYGLGFEYAEGHLGVEASEEDARTARYDFLESVKQKHTAIAIIMAHQQDDVLETAVINMTRGTGHRGLCSLRSTASIIRPLLGVSRQQIMDYARTNSIEWREDSTNAGDRFLRNRIRHNLLPKLTDQERQQLLVWIETAQKLADEIESMTAPLVGVQVLPRNLLLSLEFSSRKEVVAAWLRRHVRGDFSKRDLERWATLTVTLPVGKKLDLGNGGWLVSNKKTVSISMGAGRAV